MTADPCLMPIGTNRVCTLPGDDCHEHGCTDTPRIRCRCTHGPSVHTGGYGTCWQTPCGCDRYTDAELSAPRGTVTPDRRDTSQARFDERYDPSPEPIDRSMK